MQIDRAVIEINGGCNYSCAMCPQSSGRGKHWLRKMPLHEFEQYLDEIKPRIVNLEGSGEPTLNTNLPNYIQACTDRGIESYIFSNGYRMHGHLMERSVDAGLTYFRFSVIGYNPQLYRDWMRTDAFNAVLKNAIEMVEYSQGRTVVASYHLILNQDDEEEEVNRYRSNFIDVAGTQAEIWRQHNWAGSVSAPQRTGVAKSCGRPFSPDIVVRAGGLDGKTGAVHPCCQVLGRDDEAVLGHLCDTSIENIFNGTAYADLRERHLSGNYPSYCTECDFLISDDKVLVWSNSDRSIGHITGTNFFLR